MMVLLFIICSLMLPSLSLRLFQRQFSQEFENIYALEIGFLLASCTLHDPRLGVAIAMAIALHNIPKG
jgi:hypothetical protein